jgi:hypothetical protein
MSLRGILGLEQAEVPASPSGIASIADYTKEQLEAEDKRKASFEQRGLAVVTTSGALVTLLFGLAALSTRSKSTFELESAARLPLVLALGLFVAAAIFALLTNWPLNYEWVDPCDVRRSLGKKPPPSEQRAAKDIALTRLSVLEAAREKNALKGRLLIIALTLEVLAVTGVAVAIAIVIL